MKRRVSGKIERKAAPRAASPVPARPAPPAWSPTANWTPAARTVAALVLMWVGVLAVYVPVRQQPDENAMVGADYARLHARRIRFAQDALFGPSPRLPAWYPRELMGTPFWSNVQNFPFLPTRLVLLAFDPLTAWPVGVNLAALLAATFTYGYCRRVGLNRPAAAAAGWTFAASGYFAARVTAGHLPLLEAYPALPGLLWLVEAVVGPRVARSTEDGHDSGAARLNEPARRADAAGGAADERRTDAPDRWLPPKLVGLGLASTCVALAGHPQVPFYAFVVSGLYLLYRGRGGWRRTAAGGAAMALGVGCAAFALVPMALLIGRSTRVLPLERAANDIVFPYWRLGAFLLPWKDGWPETLPADELRPFGAGPAVFFDTVCYVGVLPVVAVAVLAAGLLIGRRRPAAPWTFFAVVGVAALVTALPAVQQWAAKLPGTFLRSPSRQVYVTTFALALALGAAVHLASRRRWAAVVAALALAVHAADLGSHGRAFVWTIALDDERGGPLERQVRAAVGDGRAAIDYTLQVPFNRDVDDVGFFDSIMLARPYAAILDLTGARPDLNVQAASGSSFNVRTLESAGVKVVVTAQPPPGAAAGAAGAGPGVYAYAVPNPLPRAAFIPASDALVLDPAEIHRRRRDPGHDLRDRVMLPPGEYGFTTGNADAAGTVSPGAAVPVEYRRDDSDRITLNVNPDRPGFVRVLESWDPGWRATVDGAAATPVPADDVFLCVPVGAGAHRVTFEFFTPGAAAGAWASAASLVGLVLLALISAKRRSPGGRAV